LLPIKGKPLIWWQITNCQAKGISPIILVLNKLDTKTKDYVEKLFVRDSEIETSISDQSSIICSLQNGLRVADPSLPTRVILGDTYIDEDIPYRSDMLLTSRYVGVTEYWCLLDRRPDDSVHSFYDKIKNLDKKNKETVVGVYTFSDTQYLLYCTQKVLALDKKEISDLLLQYMKKYPLSVQEVMEWFDLGHTSGLVRFKNKLFNTRDFNRIEVDTEFGTLTKTSSKALKLEDEAHWYSAIPEKLRPVTPRVLAFSRQDDTARLTLELYGYPALAELYISGEVILEDWYHILELLFELHNRMELYPADGVSVEDILWLYKEKTWVRLAMLREQDVYWHDLMSRETIVVNDVAYRNINAFREKTDTCCRALADTANPTVVHGDYCLSNILFDPSNFTFKLVDPRGRLRNRQSIYGDPRYDIAKLRHSVCGLYDFIVNGLYRLEESPTAFRYTVFMSGDYAALPEIFDNLAARHGFAVDEIKFIEGLLFLSMLPLHKDDLSRQKMLYLKAVMIFNEIFAGGGHV
jgi:UTP-glucose-1-phosphate uridylyltransferase